MEAEIAKLNKLLDHQKLDYNSATHQKEEIEGQLDEAIAMIEEQ